MSLGDLAALAPAILLTGGAGAIAIGVRVARLDGFVASAIAIAVTLGAAGAASLAGVGHDVFGGAVRRDSAAVFFSVLTTLSAAGALAVGAPRTTPRTVALLLLSTAGAVVTSASGDVGVLVIGLALLVLPIVVTERRTRDGLALLGALGIVVIGCADLAFATGASSLSSLDLADTPLAMAGVALVLAGLVVIAGIVSLRAGVTADDRTRMAFVMVVLRIAGIAALLRVGAALAPAAPVDWRASLALVAAVSVIVASLVAIGQTVVLRILEFASLAQAGYAAIALTAGLASGPTVAFYLAAFALMTGGALALLADLPAGARLRDLRGLGRRCPLYTAALGALLLGLGGLPPSVGVIGKLYVLELAVATQLAWLAILGALASVLSAVAYLRILFACLGEGQGLPVRRRTRILGYVAAVITLLMGAVPGPLLNAVQNVRF